MELKAQISQHIQQVTEKSIRAKQAFWSENTEKAITVAELMASTFARGGKMLICGNGGSAADAQHMAAEMVGRLLLERRRALPAIALTTDTSNITAIANDYSYEDIFRLQVNALANSGDILVAISTSGNSKNVVKAVDEAKQRGCVVVSFTGGAGGKLKELSDYNFNVALGDNSCVIQETHITLIHLLVDVMDRFYLSAEYIIK